jgi:hypothetical protein
MDTLILIDHQMIAMMIHTTGFLTINQQNRCKNKKPSKTKGRREFSLSVI